MVTSRCERETRKAALGGYRIILLLKCSHIIAVLCVGLQKEYFQPQLLDKPTVTSEGSSKWVKKEKVGPHKWDTATVQLHH